jgi:ketosteroid isomerase-like protein
MATFAKLLKPGYATLFTASFMAVCLSFVTVESRAEEPTQEQLVYTLDADRQIRNLMSRYGQYLDAKNFDGYASLFAKEAEWSGQLSEYTTIKGPDNIRAAMEKAFATRVYDPAHITNLHLITNIEIHIDGDRATGYSRWTVMSRNEADQPYARVSGHYDDVFIRENGQWKFLSREARREIP